MKNLSIITICILSLAMAASGQVVSKCNSAPQMTLNMTHVKVHPAYFEDKTKNFTLNVTANVTNAPNCTLKNGTVTLVDSYGLQNVTTNLTVKSNFTNGTISFQLANLSNFVRPWELSNRNYTLNVKVFNSNGTVNDTGVVVLNNSCIYPPRLQLTVDPSVIKIDNGSDVTVNFTANYSNYGVCTFNGSNTFDYTLVDNYNLTNVTGQLQLNGTNGTVTQSVKVTAYADDRTNNGRVYNFSTTFTNQNGSNSTSVQTVVEDLLCAHPPEVTLQVKPRLIYINNGSNTTITVQGSYQNTKNCKLSHNYTTWTLNDNYNLTNLTGNLTINASNPSGTFNASFNVTAFADNRTNDGRVYTFQSSFSNQNGTSVVHADSTVLQNCSAPANVTFFVDPEYIRVNNGKKYPITIHGSYMQTGNCKLLMNYQITDNYNATNQTGQVELTYGNGTYRHQTSVLALADNRTNDGRIYNVSAHFVNQFSTVNVSQNVVVLENDNQNFTGLYKFVNDSNCQFYNQLESIVHLGTRGEIMQFALSKCNYQLEHYSNFTNGAFQNASRTCVQRTLADNLIRIQSQTGKNPSVLLYNSYVLDAYAQCYLLPDPAQHRNNFCNLEFSDKVQMINHALNDDKWRAIGNTYFRAIYGLPVNDFLNLSNQLEKGASLFTVAQFLQDQSHVGNTIETYKCGMQNMGNFFRSVNDEGKFFTAKNLSESVKEEKAQKRAPRRMLQAPNLPINCNDLANATITNSTKSGYQIKNCNGITLTNITVTNNTNLLLLIQNSRNIRINGLRVVGTTNNYRELVTTTNGALLCNNCTNVIVSHLTVANYTGAVAPVQIRESKNVQFINCTFEQNKVNNLYWVELIEINNGKGGVFRVSNSTEVVFKGNTFTKNEARLQGGAVFVENSLVDFERNTFSHNFATEQGGAISSTFSIVLIYDNNRLNNNTAWVGGAVSQRRGCLLISKNNTFNSNEAFVGGAVYEYFVSNQSKLITSEQGQSINVTVNNTIENYNMFLNNKAFMGGAVNAESSNFSIVNQNVFNKSNAFVDGGAISGYYDYIDVNSKNMFGNNTAAEGSVMAVQLSVYNFTSDNVLANNNGTAIADLDSTDSSSHLLVILLAAIGGAILLIIVVACACKYCGKKNRDENQVGLLEN